MSTTYGEIWKAAGDALAKLKSLENSQDSIEAQHALWKAVEVALECIVATGTGAAISDAPKPEATKAK